MIKLAGFLGTLSLMTTVALAPSNERKRRRPSSLRRRALLGGILVAALSSTLSAAGLTRDTLWSVEQTCLLNHRATGLPFPCLDVNMERGFVVLRAPLARSHIVVMPSASISGVEAPVLRRADGPNYLQDAWESRRYVEEGLGRPLGWTDVGLAVNSASTRSQDQLHIHVDCIAADVRREIASQEAQFPTDHWQRDGFRIWRRSFWVKKIDRATLAGINPFDEAQGLPGFAAQPAETMVNVIGLIEPDGRQGFALLASQSNPAYGSRQFTSEHLQDHHCR